MPAPDYSIITEIPGIDASQEQLSMLLTRYHVAAERAEGMDLLEVACGAGIGLEYLAVRQGAKTIVFNYEGQRINECRLSMWEHGVFVEDSLIVTRETSDQKGPAGLWLVHPMSGQILWSCLKKKGSWVVK